MSKVKSTPAGANDLVPRLTLGLYRVEYFSSIDWTWLDFEVLAESEAQVQALVDRECPRGCRDKPYTGRATPPPDTLSITRSETVTLPYIITRT